MKVQALSNAAQLRPQKLSARETPHATIEPNTNCNIRCRTCYAIEHPMLKPLELVEREIDLAASRRKLDTLSLVGGEPTLHPDIVEIVRTIKARGILCQLLTNGVRFLDGDLALLDALIEAGVDRFIVHIDSGQRHVHGDIDRARHRICELLEERRAIHGLSITLYEGEEAEVPRVLRAHARYPHFDGVLVTLAMDFERLFDPDAERRAEPDMAKVARAMSEELRVDPAAYLPSNRDDREVCWLMYFYWLNVRTGATFALSPRLNRWMKRLFRATHAHAFFAETLDPASVGRTFLASSAAELLLQPRRIAGLRALLRGLGGSRNLRFHYAVVQQAPRLDEATGKLQICWQCPDAVVRHDRLVPVCIAGRLDPLGPGTPRAPRAVIEDVYRHLGEEPPSP